MPITKLRFTTVQSQKKNQSDDYTVHFPGRKMSIINHIGNQKVEILKQLRFSYNSRLLILL